MKLLLRVSLFCLYSLSFFGMASGQDFVTISGVVVDAETQDPLVFVSIGIQGKSIGTISNSIGEFDFHIPFEETKNVLELNILGYESFQMPVDEVLKRGIKRFELQRSSIVLDEVVINDTLTGADIYNIALNRIEKNYPMEPFMLHAFYRDIKSIGGTYVALLEAAVKIYDRNYSTPRQQMRLRERVGLVEVRKSLGYDNKFTSFFDQTNLLEDLLLHNNVRYRQFLKEEAFIKKLERKAMSFYDGKRIFIVTLKDSNNLKFYIDAMTFAFIRIEYSIGPQDEIIMSRSGLESRTQQLKKIVEFKEFAGKMYLSHIDLVTVVNWTETKTKEMKFATELHQQLLINKIIVNAEGKAETMEPMKRYGLQYQHRKYNKTFWDNYNVIKETPLDKKIIEDLEMDMTLENQFEGNH